GILAGACRAPVGKYGRAFRDVEAVRLGSLAVAEAVNRSGLVPADIEEVLMGNVIAAGLGQNPARQAALFGGLPDRVGAVTVNKVCGSGLQTVMFASDMIRAGSAEVLLAGGMESMSGARPRPRRRGDSRSRSSPSTCPARVGSRSTRGFARIHRWRSWRSYLPFSGRAAR